MGKREIEIDGNDIKVLNEDGTVDKSYKRTAGFWELITRGKPNMEIVNPDDLNNYEDLLFTTKAIYRNNNSNSKHVAGNKKGYKYTNIIKSFWDKRKQYKGKGVIVISSDPNALIERLDLLLASKNAGHTNVEN